MTSIPVIHGPSGHSREKEQRDFGPSRTEIARTLKGKRNVWPRVGRLVTWHGPKKAPTEQPVTKARKWESVCAFRAGRIDLRGSASITTTTTATTTMDGNDSGTCFVTRQTKWRVTLKDNWKLIAGYATLKNDILVGCSSRWRLSDSHLPRLQIIGT